MKVLATDREGGKHELSFAEGDTLMEVLTSEELGIRAECGGCCACATCHVYVSSPWLGQLPAQSEDEEAMLDMAFEVGPGSRLSCQISMTAEFDGMEVTVAPDWD